MRERSGELMRERDELIERLEKARKEKTLKAVKMIAKAQAKYEVCDPAFAEDLAELIEFLKDDEAYLQLVDYNDRERFLREARDMLRDFPEKCSCSVRRLR